MYHNYLHVNGLIHFDMWFIGECGRPQHFSSMGCCFRENIFSSITNQIENNINNRLIKSNLSPAWWTNVALSQHSTWRVQVRVTRKKTRWGEDNEANNITGHTLESKYTSSFTQSQMMTNDSTSNTVSSALLLLLLDHCERAFREWNRVSSPMGSKHTHAIKAWNFFSLFFPSSSSQLCPLDWLERERER